MRKLLLALGSEILMDEAVSIAVARDLMASFPDVELLIHPVGGIDLIEVLTCYEQVVMIDTYMQKNAPPGKIILYNSFDQVETLHLQNPHDASFMDTLRLAAQLDHPLPEKIMVLAIGIRQQMVASNDLSPHLADIYPRVLDEARMILQDFFRTG